MTADLVIFSGDPEAYSVRRFSEAAAARGWTCEVWDPFDTVPVLGEAKELLHQGQAVPLPRRAILRPGLKSREASLNLALWLEGQGVALQNSAAALRLSTHKWDSLCTLAAAGLPVPPTARVRDAAQLREAAVTGRFPVVVKRLWGAQGIGVMLAESRAGLESLLDALWLTEDHVMVQRFYPEAAGRDVRVLATAETVLGAMRREGAAGEFRGNLHRGGKAAAMRPDNVPGEIAVTAVGALGLRAGGVDLLETADGWVVLEVNPSPGLEGLESVTKADLAARLLDLTPWIPSHTVA